MADEKEKKAPAKRKPKTLKVADTQTTKPEPKTKKVQASKQPSDVSSTEQPKKEPLKKKQVTKLSKEKAAEKVQESKDLTTIIKQLKERNEPATEKEVTKLAKDTIKLVSEAQRSGSVSFKRESTKALVQIRNAVDKMSFAKDAAKQKVITDIDSVVLDMKNVSLYMTSLAKAQVEVIKENGKAQAKQIATEASAKAKDRREQSKADAKKIKAQAELEAQAMKDRVANELKVERAEQTLRIKRIRLDAEDRVKRKKQDLELQEKAQEQEAAERKQKIKDMTANRLVRLRNIKDDLNAKKAKHSADHKERMMLLKQKEKDLALDYKTRKDEAKAKVSELYKNIRDSNKSKVDKETHRDAHAFLKKIGEGVADANPLLVLGYTLMKGFKDTSKMLLTKSPEKRTEKKDLEKIERIYESEHKEQKKDDNEHHQEQRAEKHEKQHEKVKPAGASSKLKSFFTPSKPSTNAPLAAPKAGTVAPSTGQSNTPENGGFLDGILGMFGGLSSFLSGISGVAKIVGPLLKTSLRMLPGVGVFVLVMNSIFDFVDGFNNASKLFTDDLNPSFIKKVFSGITNIGANLLGIVDSIAHFFGVDLDLKGFFQDRAKALYESLADFGEKILDGAKFIMNTLLSPYRWAAGKLADLLVKLPFINDDNPAIKLLRNFSNGGDTKGSDNLSNAKPQVSGSLTQKKQEVSQLEDKVNGAKPGGNTTAVVDNSVKSSNTTIIGQKLSTRNTDDRVTKAGWGSMAIGR